MSLKVILHEVGTDINNFCSKIEAETGVTIIKTDASDNYYLYASMIRFSDGSESRLINSESVSLHYRTNHHAFIDDENHFFMLTNPSLMNLAGNIEASNNLEYYFNCIILGIDGVPRHISMSHNQYYAFNIPYGAENILKETIKVQPLYCCALANNNTYVYGYAKNIYINYERQFTTGLKFIDQNNNEFITLGGYLLYYNGKHK